MPEHLLEHSAKYAQLQFTFIDCPGHAKLIRTVIGGAQIMDLFMLVVETDLTKYSRYVRSTRQEGITSKLSQSFHQKLQVESLSPEVQNVFTSSCKTL